MCSLLGLVRREEGSTVSPMTIKMSNTFIKIMNKIDISVMIYYRIMKGSETWLQSSVSAPSRFPLLNYDETPVAALDPEMKPQPEDGNLTGHRGDFSLPSPALGHFHPESQFCDGKIQSVLFIALCSMLGSY